MPVFGQTPLCVLSENKWYLCPEIPRIQVNKRGGFLVWLSVHRFVYFKQTELYNYYSLCTEFLQFSSCQAKEVLKWTFADQWLLKRCLGSVRGMRRFCSFVKGTRGEELVTFFVKVERLLQIHWQQDGSQRNRYQALLTVIKAVHLTEGSSIMTTCRIPSEGLLKIFSGSEPGGMDQILYEMRSKALCRLQSYWLPQYLCSCKFSITKLKECASILKEYEDIASNLTLVDIPALLDPLGWSLGSPPSEGPTVTRTYCSKVRKRLLWRVSSASLGPRTGPLPVVPILPSKSLSNLDSSSTDPMIPPHACMETPICHLPSITTTPVTSTPDPPSRPVWGTPHYDEHLSLALSADALAGGPYENFLRVSGQRVMLHHLGLWQELDGFLNLLLKMEDGPSKALRQVLARKIMAVYLSDAWQCVSRPEGEWCTTYLTKSTVCHLINLLPSGNVMPWIYTAKQELCQVGVKPFLTAVCGGHQIENMESRCIIYTSSHSLITKSCIQGMSFSPHVSDLYDLPFETLAEKYPKVAVEAISKTHRLYYDWKPVQGMIQITFKLFLSASMINKSMKHNNKIPKKSFHLMKDKDHSFAEKPSMRPRFLEEVMRSPTNLDFFKRYLRAYDAHGALNFYHEVDKLRHVDSLLQKTKINSIVSPLKNPVYNCPPLGSQTMVLVPSGYSSYSFITLRFSGYMPSMESRQIESVDLSSEEVDSSHLKRRVINHKLITVEFLVNDLSFYLETESICDLVTGWDVFLVCLLNDNALLHQKAEMIIKLFLKSEISPKLRVWFLNVPLSLSTDDYTTLRFTVHDGLNLVLPQTRLECKKLRQPIIV
uniref:RGS domain-containing protein n=1 Tax=Oncorhynchus kisutch TaxID=8019 RepID=A0A8C7GF56_ONCKI